MVQKARDEKADTSGTVARTLAVLTVMAESGGSVGVTDVATALGLPMSTSHRLLDLLRGAGFVERDAAQRRYRLGLQFLRVANLVTQNTSFARLCQPTLERITAETGETALYCEYLADHHMAAYAAKSDSPHSLRYRITLFDPAPVECGASGSPYCRSFHRPSAQASARRHDRRRSAASACRAVPWPTRSRPRGARASPSATGEAARIRSASPCPSECPRSGRSAR